MPHTADALPDSPRPEIGPLVVNDHEYVWRWEVVSPPAEPSPPPWRSRTPPPPYERYAVDVCGLQLVTWCSLDDPGWRLRATLPSGATDWIPPPGPVPDDLGARDCYVTLADVRDVAQCLATRFVQASPRPRSIAALAGWTSVRITDPRLAELRAAYLDALWWSRAMTEFYNGVETADVQRAWAARERALSAYQSAWHRLQSEAVIEWQRRRHVEQTRARRPGDQRSS